MLEPRLWLSLLALGLMLASACNNTDCETACHDDQQDCLDDPSGYDGYSSCAASSSRDACVRAMCAQVHDRCLAQCHDDTSH
jgi:hypothetical protein